MVDRPTKRAPDAGDSAQISGSFLRLSIFLVGRLRRPRPSAGNANRWALNCDYAAVVLIKIAIWRSEYKNTLIDVLLDKENSDSYSLKINLY